MRIGLIAYASPSGLGIQTYEYYRHLNPAKTLLVDLSPLNHYPVDYTKYTDDQIGEIQVCRGIPQAYDVNEFCKDLDVIFMAETPLNYYLINKARQEGIKTIIHYNYEFLDYLQNPNLPKPDMLLAPTKWHYTEMIHNAKDWGVRLEYLPVPVNRDVLPFKQRKQIKRFLHIAGHATSEDRNGTEILHQAIKLVRNPNVEFVIRAQRKVTGLPSDRRVKIIVEDVADYQDLYNNEDCLVFPRRYGGLCLPLNEAMSQGMIPLMTNVDPQNLFLPSWCLIPGRLSRILMTRTAIGVYDATPEELAQRIEALATLPESEVKELSNNIGKLGVEIGWNSLTHNYERLFDDVLRSN
jgi:glycosyltransferase involved in cell wall biosynthesis